MFKVISSFVFLLFLSFPALPEDISVMPVSQVREGMRGMARTVFRGNRSEEFGVEILGVLPNWIGPGQDLIVGKLSGANAERTFVFAGMSGSPVYIDGKLVGAIAYSFPFAKEPICGITPFDQMRSLVETGPSRAVGAKAPVSFSLFDLASDRFSPEIESLSTDLRSARTAAGPGLAAVSGQSVMRLATPVTFAGISQRGFDMIAPQFEQAGFMPIASAGGDAHISRMKAADATTLVGGDSVVVHLARGDVQIAAAGTVTHRDGERIYAFGHPFFALGSADLPMSESHVVTVVPNANNSFKLAVADAMVGSMTQDRSTGIYGILGRQPRMLPVSIKLTTSRGRQEHIKFESAIDSLLTGLIINAGVGNALIANERGLGDATIALDGEIRIRGEQPIKLTRRFTGPQANGLAAAAASVPVNALLRAGFPDLEITGIDLNLTVVETSKTAVLDRISVDRDRVRAGETVRVTVWERSASGEVLSREIPVAIPADAAPGPVSITIADGLASQQGSATTHFSPRTTAEFVSVFNNLKRPDRLYLSITRSTAGAVVGVSEMPNLPPSVISTMVNGRVSGGTKATVQTIIAEQILQAGSAIITGSYTIPIEIVR